MPTPKQMNKIRLWKQILARIGELYEKSGHREIEYAWRWMNEAIINMSVRPVVFLIPDPNPPAQPPDTFFKSVADEARSLAYAIMRLEPVYGEGGDPRFVLFAKQQCYKYLIEATFTTPGHQPLEINGVPNHSAKAIQ